MVTTKAIFLRNIQNQDVLFHYYIEIQQRFKGDVRLSCTMENKNVKKKIELACSCPKLLSNDEKAMNIGFYMLFFTQITTTRTGQCLFNHLEQLSNSAAIDSFYRFKSLKKSKGGSWCPLYNNLLKKVLILDIFYVTLP